jgi:pimeloyl-ACP methyl ester carboxylesterase
MDNGISTVVPVEQFMIEVSGARLAVTRAGLGSPIICLHAIGHGARDFARLADELGRQYQFISIDWPGHGASPRELAPAGAARYAELLESVVDTFGISPVHILGNSVGGAAAIRYAALHPDRVRGLILCNPAGLTPVNFVARYVCRRMAAFFARGARDDPRFAAQFRRYYECEVLPAAAATWRREEIIATAAGVAPILQQAWNGFAEADADLRHLVPKVRCPTLFAWAKADRYVAWSRSKRAALKFPNRQVRLFDGGHSAFLEEPSAFVEALKEFISTSSPGAEAIPKMSASLGAA